MFFPHSISYSIAQLKVISLVWGFFGWCVVFFFVWLVFLPSLCTIYLKMMGLFICVTCYHAGISFVFVPCCINTSFNFYLVTLQVVNSYNKYTIPGCNTSKILLLSRFPKALWDWYLNIYSVWSSTVCTFSVQKTT